MGGFVYNKYSLNQLDESEKVFFSFGIFKKRYLGRALFTVKSTVLTNTKGDFVKCIFMILLQFSKNFFFLPTCKHRQAKFREATVSCIYR